MQGGVDSREAWIVHGEASVGSGMGRKGLDWVTARMGKGGIRWGGAL